MLLSVCPTFVSLPGEGLRATTGLEGGERAAGPVGTSTPAAVPTELRRKRLTNLTVWNLES